MNWKFGDQCKIQIQIRPNCADIDQRRTVVQAIATTFLYYAMYHFFSSFKIEWMKGSKLNICYNTLDRHLEKRASQVAFHWEGNDPKDAGKITYAELHKDVCKFANVLRSKGVKKVCVIYCKLLAYLVREHPCIT